MSYTVAPTPVPPPRVDEFGPGLTLIDPQSRRGIGPGLIVVVEDNAAGARIVDGIPSPLMKWAEEGYVVVEVSAVAWESDSDPIQAAIEKLLNAGKCDTKTAYGMVCYSQALVNKSFLLARRCELIVAAIAFADASLSAELSQGSLPTLAHIAGQTNLKPKGPQTLKVYDYPDQSSADFATPYHPAFSYAAEAVSHTRSLTFLKKHMNGPYFDLEAIWDEHTYYEFEKRDVECTMNTMVAEPYVNHIPTLTGGIGRKNLTDFYANHFIFSNPEGTALELISRTVGIDRVVDEFIFKLNHNRTVDWLLPGVPPTYKDLAIPFMAVVNVRGDRLYHEHITWDQATALRQAGILPESLPWKPTDVQLTTGNAGGKSERNGIHAVEIRLPVAGVESAEKMRNKNAVPSNAMFAFGHERS